MAIMMTSCCCFETIERGTAATAIYSMLTSIFAFGWVTYRIQPLQTLFQDMEGDNGMHLRALFVSYVAAIILTVCLVVSSMVLLIGTIKRCRFCLIPFLVVDLLTVVLQVPFTVFLLWHFVQTNFVNLTVLVHVLFSVPIIALNIAGFFCVIARFQQITEEPDDCDKTDIDSVEEAKMEFDRYVRRESQHLTVLKKHTFV